MVKELNRKFQDFFRPKRLAVGKYIWDRKSNKIEIKKENIIENYNIKSILFIRNDGKIGDMVINTLMFREIKKSYPDIKIGVVSRGGATDIIKHNKNVDKIYNYSKNTSEIKKLAKEIEKENYDLLIDFSEMLRVKQMMFINLCKAKINMGIDKTDWNMFDISLKVKEDFEWTEHITERYSAYLKILGIKNIDISYDVVVSEVIKNKVEKFYKELSDKRKVILNPYGASKHKTFNEKTIRDIIEYLNDSEIIIIYSPDKFEEIKKFEEEYQNVHTLKGSKSILESSALIKYSDLVISPDTSIVHIASAFSKKVVAIYPPNGGKYRVDHLVWAPKSNGVKVLFCKEKKSENDEIDINTFNMKELKENIK